MFENLFVPVNGTSHTVDMGAGTGSGKCLWLTPLSFALPFPVRKHSYRSHHHSFSEAQDSTRSASYLYEFSKTDTRLKSLRDMSETSLYARETQTVSVVSGQVNPMAVHCRWWMSTIMTI